MFRSETISIAIDCPFQDVYEFLAEPLNLPTWWSNLGGSIRHSGGSDWVSDTSEGPVVIRFAPRNAYGVLDHAIFREGETAVTTPTRVFANDDGAEITYTLFQRPGISDAVFASELEWVRSDLLALKSLLESRPRPR